MSTDNTYKKDAEMTDYLLTDIEISGMLILDADGRRVNTDSNPHTVRKSLFNPLNNWDVPNVAIIKDTPC